jgi:hypothetical protein
MVRLPDYYAKWQKFLPLSLMDPSTGLAFRHPGEVRDRLYSLFGLNPVELAALGACQRAGQASNLIGFHTLSNLQEIPHDFQASCPE